MSRRSLVADSGPLIALGRLALLRLPRRMFAEVLVTGTVWSEVIGGRARDEHALLHEAQRQGWLTVVADPASVAAAFASSLLDAGERTATTWGRSLVDEALASLDE